MPATCARDAARPAVGTTETIPLDTPTPAPPAWRLISVCSTIEEAQTTVNRLRRKGIDAAVSLVGGLSVIAHR